MFGFGAPVVTVGVVLNVVIIKVTVIICIMRDVTRDSLIKVLLWNSHLTTIFYFVLVCYCLALWTIL